MTKRTFKESSIGITQYKWAFDQDKSRNIKIFEITRSTDPVPFTVLIHDYTTRGDKQLFSDLFFSDEWDECRGEDGQVSDDVRFCIQLWRDLGLTELLGEDFHPKHIEHDTDRWPTVYRNTMENVMSRKYGCGHSQVIIGHSTEYVDDGIIRVPLNLTVGESDESIIDKISQGIVKYI